MLLMRLLKPADVGRKGAADLEKHVDSIKNFFFRDGVQMVVDGYSLEELTEILETRIEYGKYVKKHSHPFLNLWVSWHLPGAWLVH